MLRPIKALRKLKLHARDGDIGHPSEIFFDDTTWAVRYLVATTGGWLSGRQVLLSPHALRSIDEVAQTLTVDLSKKQIEDSPLADSERPISRQFESAYYVYYGWPGFWVGTTALGVMPYFNLNGPPLLDAAHAADDAAPPFDAHLRSTKDVTGHHLTATDGEIGHVEDFLIDEMTWMVAYLVVDTGNWWPGKKVLIAPHAITHITWDESKMRVDISRAQLTSAPEFIADQPLSDADEARLRQHYAPPGLAAEHHR